MPLARADVPEPLKPWVGWVLHGAEQQLCPPAYQDAGQRLCVWPARLELKLGDGGGDFELSARLNAPAWLALPGDGAMWPLGVAANGRETAVLPIDGNPAVFLTPGVYQLSGRFTWQSPPKSLRVPPETGLLSLSFNGVARPHPARDSRSHIWLNQPSTDSQAPTNHLSLRVFRLVDDAVPLQVLTRVQLEAAGTVRNELIGPVLLPGFIPLVIEGNLPARLEDDGRLRVQVRPGVWQFSVGARAPGPVTELAAPQLAPPWPSEEVWSFRARNDLRVVELSGAPGIDPRQAQTPAEWQELPAYLLQAGGTLVLAEKRRGDPQPGPDQLALRRELWLDFDGGGYSLRDHLSGSLSRSWRLSAQAPIALGRVQIDGEPQLITHFGEALGVEVRHGQLNLTADSRVDAPLRHLPATGWTTDLQSIQTTLHLPPGWRLLAAPGADNVPDTWLSRWTLLDLFIVLIASVAALRLFGPTAGVLSVIALALTWHEPNAPRWTWLNLIAAISLLRALPASFQTSRLQAWLARYRWVSAIALLLVAIPFAVQQSRIALHPQLELPYPAFGVADKKEAAVSASVQNRAVPEAPMAQAVPEAFEYAERSVGRMAKSVAGYDSAARDRKVSQQSIQRMDPNVLTQTGPGLPQWSWRTAQLSWAGPVTTDQSVRLWLMPPWLTRILNLLSLGLIALLFARWMQLKLGGGRGWLRSVAPAGPGATVLLVAVLCAGPAPQARAAEEAAPPVPPPTPSQEILDELRARLLAPPECMPACAAAPRLLLNIAGERLSLRMTAEAQIETGIPLPLPLQNDVEQGAVWQPDSVLLDGAPAELRHLDGGALWLRLPAGRHEITISGGLAGINALQLPLPLKPYRVSADVAGWLLAGVDEQGQPAEVLQLLRQQAEGARDAGSTTSQQTLPPLLIVRRTLRLGLDWDVATVVQRVGVTHTAVVVAIPLLAGEAVIGEHVRVAEGQVQLALAPGQTESGWNSRLPVTPRFKLIAPPDRDAVEIWRFDVAPIWHADITGIAPVLHQEADWWLPTYQPWPGETVDVSITRPAAAQGQVVTLDSAALQMQPGKRAADMELSLRLRASQGGQHILSLPEGLSVQHLHIDGQQQPSRVENGRVILPLRPGEQNVNLQLRSADGIGWITRSPKLDLGQPGVNGEVVVRMPPDRWTLLLNGPNLGPAVLFWPLLAVLLVIAIALNRIPLTPLGLRQWVLLMIGLSQIPVWAAGIVVAWLMALGLRGRAPENLPIRRFNIMQTGLALLTLIALSLLIYAVERGLLGTPDMQIVGNGSSAYELKWFQDRYDGSLPQVWVFSVSIWIYRVLMLLWALWLANSLLAWLRWGWTQYCLHGIWKKKPTVVNRPDAPEAS
ncbi:MAG: hypothetical protein ACRETN_10230 [Nevskiales bacterium]